MDEQTKITVVTTAAAAAGAAIAAGWHMIHKKRRRVRGRQPRYHRRSLLHPMCSQSTTPWMQLLPCGTSYDVIVSLNFDRHVLLDVLLPLFEAIRPSVNFGSPYWTGPKTNGRLCSVGSVDILELVLTYLKRSGRQLSLCPIFGLEPSSVQVWCDYGLEVLLKVLKDKNNDKFIVKWPDKEGLKESNYNLLHNRPFGPLLRGVFGVVDGGTLPCADDDDVEVQNSYYEGYTGNVEETNILVFNSAGEVTHAGVNFPGSWHDSREARVSGLWYPKLGDEMTPPGNALLGDSAFVASLNEGGGR